MKGQYRVWAPSLLACLLLALTACEKQGESGDASAEQGKAVAPKPAAAVLPAVTVQTAEVRTIQPSFEYPAVIEATQTASVTPEVSARITVRNVTPGALVKEGDLLFEFDEADYKIDLAEAEAALKGAVAAEHEAAANQARAEELMPKGHVSKRDYDLAKAKAESTKADVALAEAKVDQAKLNLSKTKVFAPFSGKISAAYYAVGDFLAPGDPTQPDPLAEIVKLDPIYAVAHVDQRIYDDFVLKRAKLRKKGIEIPELRIFLVLSGDREYPEQGQFENWASEAAAGKGTIAARILFPNPDGLLLPGHNVSLRGKFIDAVERVMVPQKAVSQDQQGHYVRTLDAEDTVQRRNIEVGIRDGSDWAVIEGLESGDRVVTEGLQKARPGTKVAPQQAAVAD